MMAIVKDRPKLKPFIRRLQEIRRLAESCTRQLTGWTMSIEDSPVQGKRHLTGEVKQRREIAQKTRDYRLSFLRTLKPDHPLYNTREAVLPVARLSKNSQSPIGQ
jgi:hypothetical protein